MRPRYLAALYYFLYFGATSSLTPYLNLFYQGIGLDTQQIGVLATLPMVTTLFASPLWSLLADLFRLHKWLLPLSMLATLPPVLFLMSTPSFGWLVLLVLWIAIGFAPIVPLADNAVLNLLGDKRHEYGKLRLWGAVGWGLGALVVGALVERSGANAGFMVFLGLMALCALVAARLPAPPRNSGEKPPRANLRQFVTERRWLGFLGSIFLFGCANAVLNNYFSLYLKALGGGEGLFGTAIAVASVSELPIFFLSAWMLRQWTTGGVIKIAFLAIVVRCFLYAFIQSPIGLIPVQLLHGLCFSAMWAASVSYVNELAPAGMGASAQSLFGTTLFGLGGAAGAFFGSQIYAQFGPNRLFQAAGLTALIGLLVFSITEVIFRGRTQVTPPSKQELT